MAFKSFNDLRGEVRRGAGGLMDVRLWRGDTEIAVKETVADDYGVDFTAVLNEEVSVPVAPLAPDEQAAALLSDAEKVAIHQKAEDDAKAAADAQAKAAAQAETDVATVAAANEGATTTEPGPDTGTTKKSGK